MNHDKLKVAIGSFLAGAIIMFLFSETRREETVLKAIPKTESISSHDVGRKSVVKELSRNEVGKASKIVDPGSEWEKISGTTSVQAAKDAEFQKLLDALCEQGDFLAALDLVDKNVGFGLRRRVFVERLFANTHVDIQSAMDATRRLEVKEDQPAALAGIRSQLYRNGLSSEGLDLPWVATLNHKELNCLSEGIGTFVSLQKSHRQLSDDEIKDLSKKGLKLFDDLDNLKSVGKPDLGVRLAKLEFGARIADADPDTALDILRGSMDGPLGASNTLEREAKLVNSLMNSNPESTAEFLLGRNGSGNESLLLGKAVEAWTSLDSDSAMLWVDKSLPLMQDAEKEWVSVYLALYAQRVGEKSTASSWKRLVKDSSKLRYLAGIE